MDPTPRKTRLRPKGRFLKMTLERTEVSNPFPENRRQSLSPDQNQLFYRSTISFGFRLPF